MQGLNHRQIPGTTPNHQQTEIKHFAFTIGVISCFPTACDTVVFQRNILLNGCSQSLDTRRFPLVESSLLFEDCTPQRKLRLIFTYQPFFFLRQLPFLLPAFLQRLALFAGAYRVLLFSPGKIGFVE